MPVRTYQSVQHGILQNIRALNDLLQSCFKSGISVLKLKGTIEIKPCSCYQNQHASSFMISIRSSRAFVRVKLPRTKLYYTEVLSSSYPHKQEKNWYGSVMC